MRKIVLVYNPVSGDALFKYKIDYITIISLIIKIITINFIKRFQKSSLLKLFLL